MGRLLLIPISIFLPAHFLFAQVSISEVAWMGSSESANHEWIELHNSGESLSVEGWTLSDGANLTITLTGTIPGGSYAVLERNRSDGVSVVSSPFLIYSGALVNTGAILTLRRADGSLVDSVSGGENWQSIGGDNTTKDTAQYTTNGWITASPTPGRANATTGSTPTTPGATSATNKTILYGTVSTQESKSETSSLPLSLSIVAPSFIYEGQPISFTAVPNGMTPTIRSSLKYQWNFGDLHTATSSSPTHIFTYPGTYNVFVEGTFASHSASARLEVTVLPMTVSLSHSAKGDVLLHNDAMYEVDISSYYLSSTKLKQIPAQTFISARETITIPWRMLGGSPFPATVLLSQNREVLTSTNQSAQAPNGNDLPQTNILSYQAVPSSQSLPDTVVEAGQSSAQTSAFGFATAVAYEEGEETVSDIETSQNITVADSGAGSPAVDGREAGDAFGVTPILTATSTSTSSTTPITTWWTYLLLTLILGGAVTSLLYKSNH